MSVRIPISADPSGANSALEQIRRAIQRAGQEGKRFADIDFSHPELKDLAADIERVYKQWESMKSLPGSLRQRLRATQQYEKAPWEVSFGPMYERERESRAAAARAGAYMFQGTRWQNQVTPRGGGDGEGSLEGIGGGIAGMFGLLKKVPGPASVMSFAGAGLAGYRASERALDEAVELSKLRRQIQDTDGDFEHFRRTVRASTEGLAMTYQESLKLNQSWASLTGEIDKARVVLGVNHSAAFARSAGLDPMAVNQNFGRLQFMSIFGNNPGDMKRFTMQLADAVGRSGLYPKTDMFLSAVSRFVETAERTMVKPPNTDAYLQVFGEMQRLGMHGRPGLMGDHGEAILANMTRGLQSPGGGEAGEFFMMRALGSHLGPFKLDFLRNQGLFASYKSAFGSGSETTNFERVMNQLRGEYGKRDPYMQYSAMGTLFGISPNQAKAMMEVFDSHMGRGGGTAMGDLLRRANINVQNVNPTAFMDLAKIANADQDIVADLQRKYGEAMPDGQREQFMGLRGDDLRIALAQRVAEVGMDKDFGYEMMQTRADLSNTFTGLGDKLEELNKSIKDLTVKMAQEFNIENRRRLGDVLGNIPYAPPDFSGGNPNEGYFGVTFDEIVVSIPVRNQAGDDIGTAELRGRAPVRSPRAQGLPPLIPDLLQ